MRLIDGICRSSPGQVRPCFDIDATIQRGIRLCELLLLVGLLFAFKNSYVFRIIIYTESVSFRAHYFQQNQMGDCNVVSFIIGRIGQFGPMKSNHQSASGDNNLEGKMQYTSGSERCFL